MVSTASEYPAFGRYPEIRFRFPEHTGNGKLREVLRGRNHIDLIENAAKTATEIHDGCTNCRSCLSGKYEPGRIFLVTDSELVHFEAWFASGNSGTHFK